MMNKSLTYTLKYPVQMGSELITEITLRRPKGKHFRKMRSLGKDVSPADVMDIIAVLAGTAPSVIDEMDIEDITAVGDQMSDFFELGSKSSM